MECMSCYESKWIPTESTIKQLLCDIPHKEIIQKPSYVAKCFGNDIITLYSTLQPTAKNYLAKICIQEGDANENYNQIFS